MVSLTSKALSISYYVGIYRQRAYWNVLSVTIGVTIERKLLISNNRHVTIERDY